MVELIKELDAQTKESFKNFQSNFDAFHKNNEEKGQDKFFVKFQIIRFASELKKFWIIFELSLLITSSKIELQNIMNLSF